MYYFYVYGFEGGDIEAQKSVLEGYLGFTLFEKDSEYYRTSYYFKNEKDENFLLQENYDGEGFLEEGYETCPLIFNVTIESQEAGENLKKQILSDRGSVLIKSRQLSI